jgi:hypothetical protein
MSARKSTQVNDTAVIDTPAAIDTHTINTRNLSKAELPDLARGEIDVDTDTYAAFVSILHTRVDSKARMSYSTICLTGDNVTVLDDTHLSALLPRATARLTAAKGNSIESLAYQADMRNAIAALNAEQEARAQAEIDAASVEIDVADESVLAAS